MMQVWRLYRTARRLSPEQMDVTANIAGLLAVEREWEHAAAAAAHSLRIHWTEEAFCALMKVTTPPARAVPLLVARKSFWQPSWSASTGEPGQGKRPYPGG